MARQTTPGNLTKKTVRVPIVGNGQQRSTEEDRDQRFINYIIETTKNSVTDAKKLFCVKRPGTSLYLDVGAGYTPPDPDPTPITYCYSTGSGVGIDVPSCVEAGDILIFSALRSVRQDAYTSYPTGFTQINGAGQTGTGIYANISTSYKIATGSETNISTGADEYSMILVVVKVSDSYVYNTYVGQITDISSPFTQTSPGATYSSFPCVIVATYSNYPGQPVILGTTFDPAPDKTILSGDNHILAFKYFSPGDAVNTSIDASLPGIYLKFVGSSIIKLYS